MQTVPQQRRVLTSKNSNVGTQEIAVENITNIASTNNASVSPNNKSIREVKSLSLDPEMNEVVGNTDDDHDDDDDNNRNDETTPLDDINNGVNIMNRDDGSREYMKAKRQRRIKLWKESPFAIGLTEPTWVDERYRERYDSRYNDIMPDESGCLCMSANICPLFGATRVGNMAVLKSSQEWVEETEIDEETKEPTIRRYTRPKLDIVVGPYWPMLCCVTYPLILGVSGWTFISGIVRPGTSIVLQFVWTVCTGTLIVALALTAFRDPGILYRQRKQKDSTWRWSDQADTYRPRHAWFDMDTGVVIEGFDHTCVPIYIS